MSCPHYLGEKTDSHLAPISFQVVVESDKGTLSLLFCGLHIPSSLSCSSQDFAPGSESPQVQESGRPQTPLQCFVTSQGSICDACQAFVVPCMPFVFSVALSS